MSSEVAAQPLSKNARRRMKKKEKKQDDGLRQEAERQLELLKEATDEPAPAPEVTVEYVSAEFSRVFEKFLKPEELCGDKSAVDEVAPEAEDNAANEVEAFDEPMQLGRKARKKAKQISISLLKQLVACPDVVEAHDVTSSDPQFLCYLKAYRNTVPVPRHWCHKRKYLQGKRGIEKVPFILPDFIANTGISEVRGALLDDELKKKGSAKMRERMQPKMGRIDIDYQVLHDAFFRYQTKPPLSSLGDLYYEGKEFEVKLKRKTPGLLSDDLKRALGMVDGVPPPWLLNIQRYGPPPAYPHLKIPGLNAPIPDGASFGYHPGGWGKPPVDELGNPLYGDVFNKAAAKTSEPVEEVLPVSKERWGQLDPVTEVDDEEEEEEDEQHEEDQVYADAIVGEPMAAVLEDTMDSGISSVMSGVSTPGGAVDLRKRGTETPDVTPSAPKELYTVLAQKEVAVGTSLYGSAHGYDVGAKPGGTESSTSGMLTTESSIDGDDSRKRARKAEKESPRTSKVQVLNRASICII
ncbi:hypothetical protein SPRG_13551 [Saprolegnia parasitica CBS 223.65]|uniref:PSP proline-rich domain-containing protein n=1 Tax=Saprolegnia parasitica (strain CBS 223.65) TaxID=695850 RepID=A0A067C388_SAPPC|nr:hypothetical protein SPRG_13551 [Saprolegnia parasitica CBS 223.65]KDO21252.1 hypothetical protein SPRG_13551 [Saprolegnia parasitica CBS 223.65]|eukprot:XP_012207996.1 hypothetical protein SPRG_13551 [Saprolegnia parasitica CBS 223.65]